MCMLLIIKKLLKLIKYNQIKERTITKMTITKIAKYDKEIYIYVLYTNTI